MNWPYFICSGADRESHEDAITTEITEDLQPTKKQLSLPIDIVNSKKVLALRKEQKRKLGKQRSMGSTIDYSPLPIDKHEPEFVSIQHPSPSLQTAERFHRMTSNDCYFDRNPLLSFPEGSMQEKTGWDHSGNEGHFSCNGSVFVPPQLWQKRILQAQAGEFA